MKPHSEKEALEFLLSHGAVRYTEDGGVTHLPCSLVPWTPPKGFVEETKALTPLYTELYHRVAQDDEFLHRELAKAREADDFIERLFQAKAQESGPKPSIYLNRNDCMPAISEGGTWPKQVEMNLMASALGEASSVVYRMHRFLSQHDQAQSFPENFPGQGLAEALARGYTELGCDGIVLLLIPIGEVSAFDQRILETRLVETHSLPTMRASLEELGEQGEVRADGELYFRDRKVSIAYFRTGYAPRHYTRESAWLARNLIEKSKAVSVPSARTQLANTKLIQLVLSDTQALERFVDKPTAQRLARSCVAFTKLDAITTNPQGKEATGREHALADPDSWVLKPHREGGGNNFFGEEMVEKLNSMSTQESEAYILMEKIVQEKFDSVRMVEGKPIPCSCFTELGYFGTAFYKAPEAKAQFNKAQGYLLRTKDESMDEGLVLGGFSFLDSLVNT